MFWSYFLTPVLHATGLIAWLIVSDFDREDDNEIGVGMTVSLLNGIVLIVLPLHAWLMEIQMLEDVEVKNTIG
jgi:uncharacterized membrane protein